MSHTIQRNRFPGQPCGDPIELMPRPPAEGYTDDFLRSNRRWLQARTGTTLHHIGSISLPSDSLRGNVENPIGVAQVPLGVAGPLRVNGQHAQGNFYIPLATTEGALVRSYERGMVAITRAGGAAVRISSDGNRISPIFTFLDVEDAHDFALELAQHFLQLKTVAEATTQHGKLLAVIPAQIGRDVVVDFRYHSADANGMNMITKATQAACDWLMSHSNAERYHVLSGACSEKRASGSLFRSGKGKHIVAGLCLPRSIVERYLHTTAGEFHQMFQRTRLAQSLAATQGYNGHLANGLAALFIACGQDVANIVNCSAGITHFDLADDGALFASVTLPALTVGTVGGGTGLGTSVECLEILGCAGAGKAQKFGEITAAVLLAGELSFGASLAAHGDLVRAHEQYGRNRPAAD